MPRPGRKVATPKHNSRKLDVYHNRFDQPCCRLLQEIKDEILNPNETEAVNLVSAIRHYLQTDGEVAASAISISNNQTKKKKKKKKKKKANSDDKIEDTEENDVEGTETISESIGVPSKEDVSQPEERISRRKRLLYNFLAKSYQNTNVTNRPSSSSLRPFVEYLAEKPIRCQIEPGAVQQAINDIACDACRKSAQEHLNKNSMLILNFGGLDDEREEAHFDYVAMEEGLGQEKERWYFVRDSSEASQPRGLGSKELKEGNWELHYSAASSRDEGNSEQRSNPWKWEHFLFFLENGILLPAMSIDDLLGFDGVDQLLPESLVKDVMERVYRLCERRESSFCEWATQLSDATTIFDEQTSMHGVGGNIEMSSFAIMKSTDETCQQILRNLLAIMWEVTQHIISVVGFSQRYSFGDCDLIDEATDEDRKRWPILRAQRQADHASSAAFAKLLELWRGYSKAIEIISVESAVYEKKVEEQSSAQGSIPAMYCNAEIRELYRRLVKAKVRATYYLIDHFQTHLDSEVNLLDPLLGKGDAAWNVNWFRYLIAQTTYQDALGDHQGERKKKNESTLSLDEMLETVVLAVARWSMESIHQGTVQKLLLEHGQRQKILLGMVEKLLETGERHLARGTREAIDPNNSSSLVLNEIKGLRDDLSNNDHATDVSSVDRSDAMLKMAALRLKSWKRCVTVMSNWLHCGVSLKLEKTSTKKYDYGWLALASTPELPFILKKQLYLQQTGRFEGPCLGGNSSFRAECMLLGLLVRWMDERYKEWQAVVAEQELLRAVSEEKLQVPPNAVLGKKNKKKKTTSKKAAAELQEPDDKMSEDAIAAENGLGSRGTTHISVIELDHVGHTPALGQPELLHPGHLIAINNRSAETADGVAEQELLRPVSEERLQASSNAVLGKKNKKKKTLTDLQESVDKISQGVIATENGPSSGATAVESGTEMDHVGHTGALNEPGPLNPGDLASQHTETADGSKGVGDESILALGNGSVERVSIPPKGTKSESSIGLLDDDKFFSAEEYLVKRLTTVMKFPANTAFITS